MLPTRRRRHDQSLPRAQLVKYPGAGTDILPELLHLLNLCGELLGEGLFEGLDHLTSEADMATVRGSAHLGLAGRVAAQAIEGRGLHDRLRGEGGGAESRSS